MPPRQAILHWPNGDVSAGKVHGSVASGLSFQASSITGPLADRCQKPPMAHLPHAGYSPRPLDVKPSPDRAVSELVNVQTQLARIDVPFSRAALSEIARIAAGGEAGMTRDEMRTSSHVLMCVLEQMESKFDDPLAARRAKQALAKGAAYHYDFHLDIRGSYSVEHHVLVSSDTDVDSYADEEDLLRLNLEDDDEDDLSVGSNATSDDPFLKMLDTLAEGEHVYIPVRQFEADGGHALSISVSRMGGDEARVTIFNSNGWECHGEGLESAPAISRSMSMGAASVMLEQLQDDVYFQPPNGSLISQQWQRSGAGAPLLTWLEEGGSARSELEVLSLRQPPQKGQDCGLEAQFAWLATVLPEADYKLVKANALNVLAEAASSTDEGEQVVQRLHERVTSSLSGHVMSPAPRQSLLSD